MSSALIIAIVAILIVLKLVNIVYKRILIPVEKVDAGTAKKHANTAGAGGENTPPPAPNPAKISCKSVKYRIQEFLQTKFFQDNTTTNVYTISPFESFYHKGKKVNPKNYIINKVDGNCMAPRNIHTGDILFIEKFDGNPDSLSIGDILLIQREEGSLKIREYRGRDTDDNERVKTLLYQENGDPKDSTQPHKISNIKGIVKMKFASN
jgi:hypothetical protein